MARRLCLVAATCAIVVYGQSSTSVDDTSLDISYQSAEGSWIKLANLNSTLEFWNNTVTYSLVKGDYISWTFEGSDIEYWGGTGPDYGPCLIQIDGESQGEFNGSAATSGTPRQIFKRSSLDATVNHTITITVASDAAPNICDLDRFVYTPVAATSTKHEHKPPKGPTSSDTRQTSSTEHPAATSPSFSSSSQTGAEIAGGIAGSIGLLGLLGGLWWLARRRRKKKNGSGDSLLPSPVTAKPAPSSSRSKELWSSAPDAMVPPPQELQRQNPRPHNPVSPFVSKLGRKLLKSALKHVVKTALEMLFESAGIPGSEVILALPSINDLVSQSQSLAKADRSNPDRDNTVQPFSTGNTLDDPEKQVPPSVSSRISPAPGPTSDDGSSGPTFEPPQASIPVLPRVTSPNDKSPQPSTGSSSIPAPAPNTSESPEDKLTPPTTESPTAPPTTILNPEKLLIITCMDARLDAKRAFGLTEDVTQVPVVRNIGGRARDALRDVLIAQYLNGPREIAVVHHTQCGVIQPGLNPATENESAELSTATEFIELSIREDVKLLKENPRVLKETQVTGWILDAVDRVTQVV